MSINKFSGLKEILTGSVMSWICHTELLLLQYVVHHTPVTKAVEIERKDAPGTVVKFASQKH